MNKLICLDDRELEEAEIIGSKRFNENKKNKKTMSWNLKKQVNSDRDCLGVAGELAFNKFCDENDIMYNSDHENTECRSSMEDKGDGVIFLNRRPYSVEVKTTNARDPYLIIPEYQLKNPKDIYVLIRKVSNTKFKIMGFTLPDILEDYYDDSLLMTVNTCYRMHHSKLIQNLEEIANMFDEE
jgi:hypothetical protein